MLQTGDEDSLYRGSSQSKTFDGVRFVLLGFSPFDETQVKSKLINGGGVNVGEYNPICTHVIVDKVVYDDPCCVAARNNGKSVVNSLWVDHSLDVGVPVDTGLILYRPVKDLNGIPGAKSFVICLTGYQRQDREDIMRMVVLMGANFSKPLVANKVTHLICYKHEGEKYELAKKMRKIKLVNHQWLEDCLRAWEILPECDYEKSGHEIEIMEAEAKDSEEEMEDYRDTKQVRVGQVSESSSRMQSGCGTSISKGSELIMPVGERSEIHRHASPINKGLLGTTENVSLENKLLTNTGKERDFQKSPDLLNVNKKGLQEFDYLGNGAYYGEGTSNAYDKTPSSSTGKRALHCDATTTFSTLSYSRKMVKSSPTLIFSGEHSSHLQSSPRMNLEENKSKGGFGNSELNLELDNKKLDFGRTENQKTDSELHRAEATGGTLTPKRKRALPDTSSGSAKKGTPNRISLMGSTTASAKSEREIVATPGLSNSSHPMGAVVNSAENQANSEKRKVSLSGASFGSPKIGSPNSIHCSSGDALASDIHDREMVVASNMKSSPALGNSRLPVDAVVVNSIENQSVKQSVTKSSNVNKKSMKCGLPVSRSTISEDLKSPSGIKMPDITTEKTPERSFSERGQPDLAATPDFRGSMASKSMELDGNALSPNPRTSEADKSKTSVNLGLHKGKKNGTSSRSGTMKMFSKRSLGSKPKLGAGSTTEGKGSFNWDQTITSNEAAFYSEENKDGAEKEDMSTAQPQMASPALKADVVIENKSSGLPCSANINGTMDDETEPPEEDNVGKSSGEEMAGPSFAADIGIADSPKGLNSASEIKRGGARIDDETLVSREDKAALKNTKVDSLVSADQVEEIVEGLCPSNTATRGKGIFKKDKDGGDLDDTVNEEQTELEKTKGVLHPANKLKSKTLSGKKTETPTGVEEKKTIETGGRIVPSGKYARKKLASKSSKKPIQTNKMGGGGTDSDGIVASGGTSRSSESGKNDVAAMKEAEVSRENKADVNMVEAKQMVHPTTKTKKSKSESVKNTENPVDEEKENRSAKKGGPDTNTDKTKKGKENVTPKSKNTALQMDKIVPGTDSNRIQESKILKYIRSQPVLFILSGHRLQRKEFQQVIRRLKGRFCRDSHHWSYQATHFIVPDPVKRTEKFFAAAASGRWILKTDYLAASNQAGKFLEEEPYEWFKNGLSEDGAINLEAPRKWRLLRERTGHGAFHGMRIIIYGDCFLPPLDTMKRVIKAGGGTILATSPPYTKFLKSGVDFAVISPGMPRVDSWVQEFLKNEIPCIMVDYLVEYVCKPGCSLERHVLYNTHSWAEKSYANLISLSEEIIEPSSPSTPSGNNAGTDIPCQVCGSRDRGEVMLICGDESGSLGCGVGTHIDCCDPPLESVPEEDWFCPKCSETRNSKSSSSNPSKPKKKKGPSKSKRYY